MSDESLGVVYLVGAGPGDSSLITVAGWRLLEMADCIVYDKLIDRRLLNRARGDAERIYVGKESESGHCKPQGEIHALLIDRAREGKRVVRLKGGDALLFSRGAEEAEALAAAGVRYEIVPGVTAALAAAATAAIPLTHRPMSSAVAFVTGHEDPQKGSTLDWCALARFPGTLVVYMALKRLGAVAHTLISNGKDGRTPVALVEWGGSNRQRIATMSLEEATAGAPESFRSPVVAIVGPVCGIRERLAWFEERPLFGQRVLVTRPLNQSDKAVDRLESLGAQVVVQAALRIEPPDDWRSADAVIDRLSDYQWLIFSSRNGVEAFIRRLLHRGQDIRSLGHFKIAAIGPATANALGQYYLRADIVPPEYRSECLAEALGQPTRGKRVLWPRADRGRDILEVALQKAGAALTTIVVYRQELVSSPDSQVLAQLRNGEIDWVMLTSSNIASGFFGWLDPDLAALVKRQVRIASISPVTSAAIRAAGFAVAAEATVYTVDGTIGAMVSACRGTTPTMSRSQTTR